MPAAQPRGNALTRKVTISVGDGWTFKERVPVLIVHIDSNRDTRRALQVFCDEREVFCKPVQSSRDGPHGPVWFAYEVDGLPEVLEQLLQLPFVIDAYHAVTGVRVPTGNSRSAGAGTLSVRHQREMRVHPLHGPQVPAVETRADETRKTIAALPKERRDALTARADRAATEAAVWAELAQYQTRVGRPPTAAENARITELLGRV